MSAYLRINYIGHNARLMHDPVCHCNHLYLDSNSRSSKLVSTSVTLASFIQPRAVVCSYRVLSNHSVCITHNEKHAAPKQKICREVSLLFI